jgi:tetratricopeptide (TPR) repeat protein
MIPPRPRLLPLLLAAGLSGLSALAAQDAPKGPAPKVNDDVKIPEWELAFKNLDEDRQNQYGKHIIEATRLFNQKRIIEALNEVAAAEKIFDQGPSALNLRGACYVEFRDFARARAIFEQAFELQKAHMEDLEGVIGESRKIRMRPVVNILFNIAEMDFVMGNWQECHDRILQILPVMDTQAVAMSRLIEFKLLLCKLKIDQVEEARKLAEKYDYLDDNPFYYYANAAIAYYDKDTEAAEGWRNSARRVFQRADILAPWEDTMIEFGYVKSFYGGDLEEEE